MSTPTEKTVVLTTRLTEEQAWALAEFFKRCGWDEWKKLAVNLEQLDLMREGSAAVEQSLWNAGFKPR